jgi:hypothetical protein
MWVVDGSAATQIETAPAEGGWIRRVCPVLLVPIGFALTLAWMGGLIWLLILVLQML